MKLRRYQKQLSNLVDQSFFNQTKVCLQLPTGGGKTIIFSHLVKNAIENNEKVLILAHRQELIYQAVAKLRIILGEEHSDKIGIIKAGEKADYTLPIQVASVQSLTRRLDNIDPTFFNLIIVDEAHHTVANTYTRILNHFASARILGVTATPCRLDGKGLDERKIL